MNQHYTADAPSPIAHYVVGLGGFSFLFGEILLSKPKLQLCVNFECMGTQNIFFSRQFILLFVFEHTILPQKTGKICLENQDKLGGGAFISLLSGF